MTDILSEVDQDALARDALASVEKVLDQRGALR
ncbi:hypothetical protein NBEOAGPD_3301 [Methylobacterium gregans]|uniref:Uncharacterized protein n=1 Tax=Methylobacterium gregans TaxID=374424 RepID=A0AA37HQW6_9HYPH|nr:hypothetical protein [Methylobacterium gregans]GJD80066.1 hypothetical protein NBEOAGPD_3301 [Methylobacterium gregans]